MPPPAVPAPLSEVALFGKDATSRIVDVQPVRSGPDDAAAAVRVYRRSEDGTRVYAETEPFYPFLFLSDVALLRGFPRERYRFQRLEGDNFYRFLVVFGSWGAYWDAVRHVERAVEAQEKRPEELYLVNNPAQQYLLQTGRTLFKGMSFDELHRLQLDIEVYTESGFPNAARAEDAIIIISLSDNRGWTRLIEGRALPERAMLQELVRVIREQDPDVIEGHNCFRAGTPVMTPGGYAPIERLEIGDRVVAHGPQGLTESRVTHRFENDFSGDLISLHAVYKGRITSTPDHPHFGYTKRHGLGYWPARDFKRGDYLAVPLRQTAALSFDEDFYLAGLVFSDGHLSKDAHRISFGNTDKALVEWVASRIGGRGTIRYRNGNERHAPLYRLRTHDAQMHAWLQSLGIPAGDKSSNDAPIAIERIAEQGASRIASFLAGVIDGDGHISSTNGNLLIACRPKRGRAALQALAQHIGLVASESASGILLRPTETADATLHCIQGWLRIGRKRTAEMGRTRRRVDELPFVVIEIIRPFIKSLGLGHSDFSLPRATVSYYLNGRTSINRSTFVRLEETIEAALTENLRSAWERAKAELDQIRNFYWLPIRRKSTEPFTGLVYNIETEHHNYITSGILTHNCYAFDVPYLMARCERHDVPFAIGRDGSVPRTFPSSIRFAERTIDFPALEIAGRHVVDTYFQVMAYDVFKRDLRGYGLKAAARYFGFAPEGRTYVEGGDIGRVWKEDPERLLAYALDDVIETERLARHLSGSTFYLTQMLPMPYGQVARTGPASKIESLFVREYLRRRHALPKSEWGSQAVGGYTDVFVTGVVGPVVYADVESLYPSIMLHYDVRPRGDALHLFPDLLRRLTDLRFEAKKAMREAASDEMKGELDARQTAYKNVINCFDPETEVVTVDGIKPIADVRVGDRVYAIDPATLDVEIKPVVATYVQHYEGPMVEIKTRHVDYLVTPNHRFLTQKFTSGVYAPLAWEEAAGVVSDRVRRKLPPLCPLPASVPVPTSFCLAAKCEELGIEFKTGPRGIKERRQQARWQPRAYAMEDWLALLGWYISAGTSYKSTPRRYANGHVRGVDHRVTICQKSLAGRDNVRTLLDRMGLVYSEGLNGFSFCSKILYEVLRAECGVGSYAKRIPEWVFALTPDRLTPLFDALMGGDGHANGQRYSTASRDLAYGFLRLAMHLGRRVFLAVHDGCYRLHVNRQRGQEPTIKADQRRVVSYCGMIHCVTVADHHTLLCGRNGLFNWCGQSFYGSLGFSLAAFNDFAEADRVASIGQEILRQIIALIRREGGRVIEVDTDGVLFVPPEAWRGEEAERAFVAKLSEEMPEGIRIGFDGRFQKMLSYKKKNYALLTYDGRLKFKGSSLVSRSSEAFGRRFVREAIERLLEEDVQGLHDLYLHTRDRIIRHDWKGVERFQRTETLKDTAEQYLADVEAGRRPRAAAYELAIEHAQATGQPPRKGDRIAYYITGTTAGVTAFEHARLASQWNPEAPDENTAYYLKRLDELARKFEPFFTEHDFRLVFSPEDLFGFSAEGIHLQQHERAPRDVEDEVPF